MHKDNLVLMQQYQERRFTKYYELLSCLLVAEQNNELLLKIHGIGDPGTTPTPETWLWAFTQKEKAEQERQEQRSYAAAKPAQ